MQYVYQLLKSRAYSYVNFPVSFAHRDGAAPSATIKGAMRLTDLDVMNNFDEIWFFGFDSDPSLAPDELALLDTFMSAPKQGGILVTGDHANLGQGIAGQIRRAGKMRLYPAPDNLFPDWNTTLVEGPDPGATYDFDDQSDDTPQQIRYKRYIVGSRAGVILRTRPHPLPCGPDGPIDVLPDHQHEGEALAPIPKRGHLLKIASQTLAFPLTDRRNLDPIILGCFAIARCIGLRDISRLIRKQLRTIAVVIRDYVDDVQALTRRFT